jgi:polar amino acid transport system substrate-binding protein
MFTVQMNCRGLLAATLLSVVMTGGAAFADERTPQDPRLHTPGKLTVGTGDPVYPPWMLNNDPAGGEGFENGLIYALAEEMGFAPEDVVWVPTTFDQAIAPGPKEFDFNIQQISVTEARAEVVTFSQVYFQPEKAVIALPGSPVENASSFDDLRNARWGAVIGTTDLAYLESILGIQDAAVYDDQNVFAKILRGDMSAHKVYEDDATIAIMDIMPRGDGHVLVLPKVPSRNILDIEPDALSAMMRTVQKVARAAPSTFVPSPL